MNTEQLVEAFMDIAHVRKKRDPREPEEWTHSLSNGGISDESPSSQRTAIR